MENQRSRNYEGYYTNKDGKKSHFKAKVFPRLVVLGLTVTLTTSAGVMAVKTIDNIVTKMDNRYRQELMIENKQDIKKILNAHPDMLYDKKTETYTVHFGDNLGSIAEDCGNTVNRLVALNGFESSKQTLQANSEIIIERIIPYSDVDTEIAVYESYLGDYLFYDANLTENARKLFIEQSNLSEEEQQKTLKNVYDSNQNYVSLLNIIYGNQFMEPLNSFLKGTSSSYNFLDANLDANSLYGKFISNYGKIHDSDIELTDELKANYLDLLQSLAQDAYDKITYNGESLSVVSPSQYKVYCLNGTTEYDEIIIKNHTIYG